MQYLGFLGMLDVPWTSGVRLFLVQGSFFLDSHMWPLVTVHRWIWESGKVYKDEDHEKAEHDAYAAGFETQPADDRAGGAPAVGGGRGGGRGGRYLIGDFYLIDLYFYRDITRYCYSLAFSAILLVAFFFLWQVDDYTDPKFTDRWRLMHIEHWWSLGVPRSFLYFLGYSIVLVVAPAIALEYTYGTAGEGSEYIAEGPGKEKGVNSGMNRSMKHATTMLVAGLSLTVYVWFLYIFTTMMRRVFIAKTKHAKAYSSVVLLKNTLKWKATLLLVLVFLNYMPTCLYVLGGMVPVYSSKVWSNTLKYDPYYREADYTMPDMVPPDYGSNMKDSYWLNPDPGLEPVDPHISALESLPDAEDAAERKYLWLYGGRRRDALGARELRGLSPLPVLLPELPPEIASEPESAHHSDQGVVRKDTAIYGGRLRPPTLTDDPGLDILEGTDANGKKYWYENRPEEESFNRDGTKKPIKRWAYDPRSRTDWRNTTAEDLSDLRLVPGVGARGRAGSGVLALRLQEALQPRVEGLVRGQGEGAVGHHAHVVPPGAPGLGAVRAAGTQAAPV